jgi:hypothetical protein
MPAGPAFKLSEFYSYHYTTAPPLKIEQGGAVLVADALREIDQILTPGGGFRWIRVKRKPDSLRLYHSFMSLPEFNQRVKHVIKAAKDRADITCETCGAGNATLRKIAGYATVRCDKHKDVE